MEEVTAGEVEVKNEDRRGKVKISIKNKLKKTK